MCTGAAEESTDTGGSSARRPTEPDTDNIGVGAFRFWFVGQRWEWSDEVALMHGYEPGSVVPTTELLLSHNIQKTRNTFRTCWTGHCAPRARSPVVTALLTRPAMCTMRSWWLIGWVTRRAQWWEPPVITST
jgi:hypothetical protein